MKILIAGHCGMVGGALTKILYKRGNQVIGRSRRDLDFRNQAEVDKLIEDIKPEHVYIAAAKVGGIYANNAYPAEFIYDNLLIAANLIRAAWDYKVQRLLFLGSSCIYPRLAEQPMAEEALLTGLLEPTNEPYAIAKIAGIKMCESYNRQYGTDFRAVMPTNLYGPGDNFDVAKSHVLPALMTRLHTAKVAGTEEVSIWGTGNARREFLHVDDMAEACVHVMNLDYDKWAQETALTRCFVNVGTGEDISIKELAEMTAKVVGYKGKLVYDASKPDGAPRKLLNVDRIHRLGWRHKFSLEYGIKQTYDWFMVQPAVRGN